MQIVYHNHFEKAYRSRIKPHPTLIRKTKSRIKLFINDPQTPQLHDHALTGSKIGLRAFSITGDIRIIYQQASSSIVRFLDIGTHNQVY